MSIFSLPQISIFGSFAAILLGFDGPLSAGELHDAVRADDAAAIVAALDAGVEVDGTDYVLGTALHVAVSEGNVEITRLLIEHGANVDAEGELEGGRPLHLASTLGDVQVLKMLLDSGAEVDAVDNNGSTPLHKACVLGSSEVVRLLLDHRASVNVKDAKHGRTPLAEAALAGEPEHVKLLVEAGADLEAKDNAGRTPLRFAATTPSWSNVGGPALVDYLLSVGADINAREATGHTILAWAKSVIGDEALGKEIIAHLVARDASE